MSHTTTTRLELIERACIAAAPYENRPGVIGAYLAGSSIRTYSDSQSDIDVWVVYDDAAYDALPLSARYAVTFSPDPPHRKLSEIMCVSVGRLEEEARTRCDGLRAMRHHAVILYAIDDKLRGLLDRIGLLPDEEREPRTRIAYREFLWAIHKAERARARGHLANARLLEATSLDAAWRLLVTASGERPTRPDWAMQEIRLAGTPPALADAWETAMASTTPALTPLKLQIDERLTALGFDFHLDEHALFEWIAFSPEGAAARERFSKVL